MYAVIQLVKQSMNPSKEHLDRALYICRYLISIRRYMLVFDGSNDTSLLACSDSNWGANQQISCSQSEYFLKLVNAVFLWNSHQQDVVTRSSTEAEYISMSNCTSQVIGIKQMLKELGFVLSPVLLYRDNQGTILSGRTWSTRRTIGIYALSTTLFVMPFKCQKTLNCIISLARITQLTFLQRTWDMSSLRNSDLFLDFSSIVINSHEMFSHLYIWRHGGCWSISYIPY